MTQKQRDEIEKAPAFDMPLEVKIQADIAYQLTRIANAMQGKKEKAVEGEGLKLGAYGE